MNIRYPIYEGVYRILTTKDSRGVLLSCVTIAQRSPDTLMKKTVYTFFIFPLLPHPRMSLRA